MMTDENNPDVVVHSEMVQNPGNSGTQHISFSLDSPVSGVSVSASGFSLIFQPGSHVVRINLPANCSGKGHLVWEEPDGTPETPPPPGDSPQEGDTWVQFAVENSGQNQTFTFTLGADNISNSEDVKFWPTVVSDPPPSIVFESS